MNYKPRPKRSAFGTARSPQAPRRSFNSGQRRGGGRGPSKQHINHSRLIKRAVQPKGEEIFVPKHTFADFNLGEGLQANLKALGYEMPTPIQDQAIPAAMEGRDVLGLANTGTGKTAAFLLPLIEKVLADYQKESVLILAPTRELAQQIEAELIGFAKGLRLGSVTIIGGSAMGPQLAKLRRNPHFVIGTPGRVRDLINRGAIHLDKYSNIVLDEVDRMLDMGFVAEIKQVLAEMPEKRQSLFFSATISRDIEQLIAGFLRDPVNITVSNGETTDSVDQDIVRVEGGKKKIDVLHDLLIREDMKRVLVFGETKFGVERLTTELDNRGFKAVSIHGNKSQGQRSRAIGAFKNGDVNIMVATDVAARGIDIKDITHVINYDLPNTYDDYTHRIGRTGRGGKIGYALTFVD